MRAPDWYAVWREEAYDLLREKQHELGQTYGIGSWPRWDYDLDAGILIFSDGEKAKLVAEINVVGTTAGDEWLWSWANPHLPEKCIPDIRRVVDFGAANEIEELTTNLISHKNPEGLGWMLTAVATRVLNTAGAYRSPSSSRDGVTFMTFRSIERVS